MKIENLKTGQSFKNYKSLCLELEIEVKSSTCSKDAQMKELSRYCKMTKSGHKITINEIYETPLEKIENRGKSEGSRNQKVIYGDMIQLLIADILAQGKSSRLSISRTKLLGAMNMINENYSFCGENVKKLAKYTNIDEAIIYDFYNTCNNNFKSTIESALKKLMDKRVIWYDTVTKVAEKTTNIHRLATHEEKEIILKCEKDILDELGYKTVSQVRTSSHWKLFKKHVTKQLNKKCQIQYYYIAYDINVNEEGLLGERKELFDLLLEDNIRDEMKDELNDTVYFNIVENAKKRQEKGTSGKMDKYRQGENYIPEIKEIARLVIDDNAKDIRNNVLAMEIDDNSLTDQQLSMIDSIPLFG